MAKLGKNEPCWCGSGKKYKKCHERRSSEKPLGLWDALEQTRASFQKKLCLAKRFSDEPCSKKIVSAHTIPKSGSLRKIADLGHVVGFKLDLKSEPKKLLQPQKVGIAKASTFFGFCSHHDQSLFSCLENEPFSATNQQCVSLAFRAISRDYHAKMGLQVLPDIIRQSDRGANQDIQLDRQMLGAIQEVLGDAAVKDYANAHSKIGRVLYEKKWGLAKSLVFQFAEPLPFMFSGAFIADETIYGDTIQDISDPTALCKCVSISCFATGNEPGGAIVLTWLSEDECQLEGFIESVKSASLLNVANILFQLAMVKLENIFFQEKWLNDLNDKQMSRLLSLLWNGLGHPDNDSSEVDPNFIFPTPSALANFEVTGA